VRRSTLFVSLLLGVACGEQRGSTLEESRKRNAPPIGASSVDRPHVVFTSSELLIDLLGSPVPPPVSIASTPSPSTMESDAPDIVSVGSDGSLVAHRSGSAVVRARGDSRSQLRVRVELFESLRIVPEMLVLSPGEQVPLRVSGDGGELPASALRWSVSNPAVVTVIGGRARGGSDAGLAVIEASYGDRVARAEVRVRGDDGVGVFPERAQLHVGTVQAFRTVSHNSVGRVTWSARDEQVLARLQDGIFQALRPGRTSVCANFEKRRACADVEVVQ
jgi:hypothetical protein